MRSWGSRESRGLRGYNNISIKKLTTCLGLKTLDAFLIKKNIWKIDNLWFNFNHILSIMEANSTYYIYNYSVQPEILFRDNSDIELFLSKINYHLSPCGKLEKLSISPTSFHACITFKSLDDLKQSLPSIKFNSTKLLSKQLGCVFNSYAQSYNAKHKRAGNLFRKGFKQFELCSPDEFEIIASELDSKENLRCILN